MGELNITGYYTLRRDLMRQADELNKQRLKLVELQEQMSRDISRLVEASERIFSKAVDELDSNGELKKEFGGPMSKVETETDVESVDDHVRPSKRNCGLCGKPGHRRQNCPDADTIIAEQKREKAAKDERKERKAALKGTGKRACSNCRKPGHRAKNCPEPVLAKKRGKKGQ